MFKQSFAVILACAFAVFAGGVKHMQNADAPSEIAPDPDNAIIVFHTNTNFHLFKPLYEYFIDSTMVGQTQINSYFLVKVTPGTHWMFLTIDGKPYNTARMDFAAGKLYYILEKAVPGGQVWLSQTPDDFKKYLGEDKPQFLVFKPAGNTTVIKEKKLAKAREEFEKELKEEPGKHDDMIKYPGY